MRRGTTTDKAEPGDYSRFFRLHLDEYDLSLQERFRDIRRDLDEVKERSPALTTSAAPDNASASDQVKVIRSGAAPKPRTIVTPSSDNLLDTIKEQTATESDPVTEGLIKEARKINAFLETSVVPWDLQVPDKATGEVALDQIEAAAKTFWTALATLIERDVEGRFEDSILEALSVLAKQHESPIGKQFTSYGTGVRYYPLVMSLYIVFIVGAFRNRNTLLKKTKNLELLPRSQYEDARPVSYSLFLIRRAEPVFQTRRQDYPTQTWCDAVGSVIREAFDRYAVIGAAKWEKDPAFNIGEFLLSLTPVDTGEFDQPASGTYYFFPSSIPPIKRLLSRQVAWVTKIYDKPLRDILTTFDAVAPRLARVGRCWGDGFQAEAVATAFPNKTV